MVAHSRHTRITCDADTSTYSLWDRIRMEEMMFTHSRDEIESHVLQQVQSSYTQPVDEHTVLREIVLGSRTLNAFSDHTKFEALCQVPVDSFLLTHGRPGDEGGQVEVGRAIAKAPRR